MAATVILIWQYFYLRPGGGLRMGAIVKNDSSIVKSNDRKSVEFWEEFKAVAAAGGVPEHRLRWYEGWASQFARSARGVPLRQRTREHVQAFLVDLARNPSIQPWQLQQAEEAVRLLCRDYLHLNWADPWPDFSPSPIDPPVNSPEEPPPFPATRKDAPWADALRQVVRLRHYSHRTEEAYRQWIERFLTFHSAYDPASLAEVEIRTFLTYLADKKTGDGEHPETSPECPRFPLRAGLILPTRRHFRFCAGQEAKEAPGRSLPR